MEQLIGPGGIPGSDDCGKGVRIGEEEEMEVDGVLKWLFETGTLVVSYWEGNKSIRAEFGAASPHIE